MRKLILRWLFGVDIEEYMKLSVDYGELSDKYIVEIRQHRERIAAHIKTLDEFIDILKDMKKLIKICENHSIDIDEEIKNIELLEE